MTRHNLFETIVADLPEDDCHMRLWLRLLGCFTSVERTLRKRLRQRFDSSLPRYDVLTALARYSEGLTMGQLARELMVSKGNVTGVVRRLVNNGLATQSTVSADRRRQLVALTPKGRSEWTRMHAEYRSLIAETLGAIDERAAKALVRELHDVQKTIDTAID